MPGDEVHEEGSPVLAGAGGGSTGPRHAAPRKPLLSRLHVPAGKAIAMAAMPSAVLMGMGFTPQLAYAKPMPKSPMKDGHCVSQEDRDAGQEEKEKAEKEKAEKEKAEREKAEKEQQEKEGADKKEPSSPAPDESGSGDSSGDSGDSGDSSGSDDGAGTDEDADEEKKNPLDPLGWGEKIRDAFTPDDKKDEEAEKEQDSGAAAEEKSGEETSGEQKAEPSASPSPGQAAEDLKDATDGLGDRAGQAAGKAGDGSKGADGKEQENSDEFPRTKAEAQDALDKGSLPCVEEKKSDGDDEKTPATLPNDPWTLNATSLSLHGLDYKGVVNVKTADGRTKQALKFTADSLDIGDLHQTVEGPGGTTYHVQAAKGSTSTIRGGEVTMYTEELKGKLFGLIPVTFSPEHPPPLNVPEALFTDVTVTQAGQFGGNLTIPGLHQFVE